MTSSQESKDFPQVLVRAIEALADKSRRQILMKLEEHGSLAYSEIQGITQPPMEKGTLNYHLEKLLSGALVRNFRGNDPASQYTSYYELTSVGKTLVDNLFASFRPPSQEPLDATSSSKSNTWAITASTSFSAQCPIAIHVSSVASS
jgi:DNA-binding HxlR family transcriptional regulator